ncbi:MAG TPA: methyltransferase domain-containing protein, partial [Methanoregula sp.]|nr:methyltransferase domain-containing protein [Methanoregula sp.]
CTECDFSVGTADRLPFRDASFDAVSSLLVFTYLKHPEGMLSEAFRVLRPGGSIAICTLGKKLLTRGIPALYHISEKMRVRHVVMKNFGEHYYDERDMRDLFSGAGFEGIEVQWCSFAHINMIDPVFSLARRIEPFVEKRVPQLAFNICVSARKPE